MCKSNTSVKNLRVYAKQLVKEQEQKAVDCSARLAKAPPTTPPAHTSLGHGGEIPHPLNTFGGPLPPLPRFSRASHLSRFSL